MKGTPPPQATQSDTSQLGWGDQQGRPFREEEGRHGSAQRHPRPCFCARQCGQRCQGGNSRDPAGVRVLTPPVRAAAQSCQLRKRNRAASKSRPRETNSHYHGHPSVQGRKPFHSHGHCCSESFKNRHIVENMEHLKTEMRLRQ